MTLPNGPTVSKGEGGSDFSTYTGSTATLYNLANQSIVLTTNEDATPTTSDSWLTVGDAKGTSHTITINEAQGSTSTTGTVTFTNDAGGKTTVTVALANPAITALTDANFTSVTGSTDNTFQTAETTGSNAKVTMANAAQNNSFTLTVTSPEGVTASVPDGNTWITVETGEKSGSAGSYTNVITVTLGEISEKKTTAITLANAITGGGDLTVDLSAEVSAP